MQGREPTGNAFTATVETALFCSVPLAGIAGSALWIRSAGRRAKRLRGAAESGAEGRRLQLVTSLPPGGGGGTAPGDTECDDEMSRAARSFIAMRVHTDRLIAARSALRGTVDATVINLSRRSHELIQRQVALLVALENCEDDPEQLATLLRLDHFATRVRRHGEGLPAAGPGPGRKGCHAVPFIDVLRAAAAGVERYERVQLVTAPYPDVRSAMVDDLVRLLTELMEHVAAVSCPGTPVRVSGHCLPGGRTVIEVHGTGAWRDAHEPVGVNERLIDSFAEDLSSPRRTGLRVVGRIARRHRIHVQLCRSTPGGIVTRILLPRGTVFRSPAGPSAEPSGTPGHRGGT